MLTRLLPDCSRARWSTVRMRTAVITQKAMSVITAAADMSADTAMMPATSATAITTEMYGAALPQGGFVLLLGT